MESPTPLPSTPLNGMSLRGKWTFPPCTPELEGDYAVRKKLFDSDSAAVMNDSHNDTGPNHWNSSGYFSQSANDASCMSGDSHTNLFDENSPPAEPQQDLSASFFTPNSSPSKRPVRSVSMCETPPPLLKKQRLFSPSSPATPDKFPASFRSPVRPSPFSCTPSGRSLLDSSCDSLTALNELAAAHQPPPPITVTTNGSGGGGDVMMVSPPRLERLQLLDYPRTPLSIARSSGLHLQVPSISDMPQEARYKQNQDSTRGKIRSRVKHRLGYSGHELMRYQSRGTNINPFTPTPEKSPSTSPFLNKSESRPHKRLALRESNISRYREEFHEVCVVGSGSFGTVYKCINRLDGCIYALKRSHKPVAGSADEAAALREVCAHAVLGSHTHLVRYYSAWAEDNHMLIQNEFCDGGNLSSRITCNKFEGKVFQEAELKRLLRHISLGLQYIHSMGLVHMDIKPENIFLSTLHDPPIDPNSLGIDATSDESHTEQQFIYKIGDMGHVTSTSDPHVEEGDCRYLPREILQENYSHLPKADIFSLGLTVFHAGSGLELPKNGDLWHKIRDDSLPVLTETSTAFNQLLQLMVHSNATERPTASQLLTIICPSTLKSKAQLCKELNEEKFKNEILQRELKVARQQEVESSNDRRYLNGVRLNRSMSIA